MPINANVSGGSQITASVGETQIDVGVSGGFGPSGAAGPAASVTVGTVTTGSPGSSASVVNAGSSSAAVLNFTIPAGATGATGPAGPAGATGPAGTTTWAGITDKPSTFTPSTHTHVAADISDFTSAVIAAAPPTTNASLLTSGTLADARLSANVVLTGDSRLTDSREWSADTITQAETEAGTATTRRAFTALRVFQAIAAWWNASAAKTKLDGIATGATANATDAQLRDRATHTGTQAAATITGLATVATSGSAADLTGTLANARLPSAISVTSGNIPTFTGNLLTLSSSGGNHGLTLNDTGILQRVYTFADGTQTKFSLSSSGIITVGTWQGSAIAVAYGGTGATTASAARTNLGLAIGTDVPALLHTHSAADVISGQFDIARIPTGTTSTTVAVGNHTHSQLHDRSHAITSTSDHTATAWRVFHSNGSGQVVELALGASGTVLTSGGASAAPSFAALPAGGTKTLAIFTPRNNQPPSTNFATLDTRNSIAVLDFDDATKESALFPAIIPEGASLGSGLVIRIVWMATTATTNACRWEVSLERGNTDLDSDSFDTVATAATTTNGTSGIVSTTEITLTTIDSVAAGELYRLRVARDAANAADTMTGDAELVAVEVRVA